jgi:hypothetical protein
MMDWALAWSDQKSGRADSASSLAISFSFAATSKMLQGCRHAISQVLELYL